MSLRGILIVVDQHVIRMVGVLFYIAMAFSVMPWKYAIFAGTACMIIAPAVRHLMVSKD